MSSTRQEESTLVPFEDNFYTPVNDLLYSSDQYPGLHYAKHEIRLLEVVLTEVDGPVHVRLINNCFIQLEGAQADYCALSYFAGNHKKTRTIFVNGIRFIVFRNLERALRQVRLGLSKGELQDYPRLIWADQICINQSDPEERSHQVRYMRQIYEHASVVLAWPGKSQSLGHWLPYIERCLNARQHIGPLNENTAVKCLDNTVEVAGYKIGNFKDSNFIAECKAFSNILHSPLWERGWIQQELTVARRVLLLCQPMFVDLEKLAAAVEIADHLRLNITPGLHFLALRYEDLAKDNSEFPRVPINAINSNFEHLWLSNLYKMRKSKEDIGRNRLLLLLNSSRYCKVSDLRDKIFAFLGLSSASYGILPDYKARVEIVFQETSEKILCSEKNLDILAYSNELHRMPQMPSWVPDWSSKLDQVFLYAPAEDSPPFRASGDSIYDCGLDLRSTAYLRVKGLFLDGLDDRSIVKDFDKTGGLLIESWAVALSDRSPNVNIVGREKDSFSRDDCLAIGRTYFSDVCQNYRPSETPSIDFFLKFICLRNFVDNVVYFRSLNGYYGIADKRVQAGDRLYIIFGSRVPLILRPTSDHFTLVGQAYIIGLMYGEAVKMMDSGALQLETVEIG